MGDALVLTTMRFAHEIRSPKDLDLPGKNWTDKEMKLARQLMDSLSDKWNPKEFRDTYADVLREVIEAKVKGREIVTPEQPQRPRMANIMKALEASLKERPRQLAKAAGRRTHAGASGRSRKRRKAA